MDSFDPRLHKCMTFLQDNNMPAYVSFKQNLEAVCHMEFVRNAEKTFLAGDLRNYECYCLWKGDNADFARYLDMKNYPDGKYYLHIRQDYPFALAICTNPDGYIIEKRSICRIEKVEDVLYTFIDSLFPTTHPKEQGLASAAVQPAPALQTSTTTARRVSV